MVEESQVTSSGSNGRVERGIQGLDGQLRALLIAFEGRVKRETSAKEQIVTCMPEYGAYLVNRIEVGKDWTTANERSKGKTATMLGIESGEKLFL